MPSVCTDFNDVGYFTVLVVRLQSAITPHAEPVMLNASGIAAGLSYTSTAARSFGKYSVKSGPFPPAAPGWPRKAPY
jgi:hypothetical protein